MYERISISNKMPEIKTQSPLSQIGRRTNDSQSFNSPVDRILFLQRTIGNQAVQKLVKSGTLQAKLRIGQPGDIYEQAADRAAEQVMRMIKPEVQRQPEEEEEEEQVQVKGQSGQTMEVTSDLESHIQAVKGGGDPIPEVARSYFEPRFGADFSPVRLHMDSFAASAATDVQARAFTTGKDIFFGAGEYSPYTTSGRRLLAHELAHVVQQRHQTLISKEAGRRRTGGARTRRPRREIIVALLGQQAYALEGPCIARRMGISSGRPGNATPTGNFRIDFRDIDHKSSNYGRCVSTRRVNQRSACSRRERYERRRDGGGFCVGTRRVGQRNGNASSLCGPGEVYHGDPMPYYQRFTPGIGFHIGGLPGHPDSHGCVRLSPGNAAWLWDWAAIGTRVRVLSSWSPPNRYNVQAGDTLGSIARCYAVSLPRLRAVNRNVIRSGDVIRKGDVLTIPSR